MTPVVLLGGLNVVRALGLAGIPVIIASSERRTPSMASRYCSGVIELPPIAEREAVVEALVRAAPPARRARAALLRQRRPPRAGAGLPRRARAALRPAAERARARPTRCSRSRASRRSPSATACRCRAASTGRRSRPSAARCWSSRKTRTAGTTRASACSSSAAPARRASSRTARRRAPTRSSRQLAAPALLPGVHARRRRRHLVVPRLRRARRRGAGVVRRPQDPHLSRAHRRQLVPRARAATSAWSRSAATSRAPRPRRRLQDGFQAQHARRPLLPARDQHALQPVALPRRRQRREPAARRLRLSGARRRGRCTPRRRTDAAAGSACATTGARSASAAPRRADAGRLARLARPPAQGLQPLLLERSAAVPAALARRRSARALTRRMHRWLSTAS